MEHNISQSSPIGIFDSGIGGLTVAKAVMDALPGEDIIYFGDSARVPYGIKSQETVRIYSNQIARFLLNKGVKMIIIACNTASAAAHDSVQALAGEVPVLNVIESGTKAAIRSGKKHIGVIGTLATIGSGAYEKSLKNADQTITVKSNACPLLVPLAEEGWIDNEVTRKTIEIYLSPFKNNGVEALILGCTHYPLFKQSIQDFFEGKELDLIDSAESVAKSAKKRLDKLHLLNYANKPGTLTCFVSDRPQRFNELAERFLGREPESIIVESLRDFEDELTVGRMKIAEFAE
ncbi:MAG: glutamate racemase [Balneolaceae bacterium]|nr:MAG: glutamate racemase [Balneolaceae bacterium]